MTENAVSQEVAEAEFERMIKAACVELEGMTEEEIAAYEDVKRPLVKAIQRRSVVVQDSGFPTLILSKPVGALERVTFREPTGSSLLAAGDSRVKNEVQKLYNMMGDNTGIAPAMFGKMCMPDVKIAIGLAKIFLV